MHDENTHFTLIIVSRSSVVECYREYIYYSLLEYSGGLKTTNAVDNLENHPEYRPFPCYAADLNQIEAR